MKDSVTFIGRINFDYLQKEIEQILERKYGCKYEVALVKRGETDDKKNRFVC